MALWAEFWERRRKGLSMDDAQAAALAAALPDLMGGARFRRMVVKELGPPGKMKADPKIGAYLDRLRVTPSAATVATLTGIPEALQTATMSFLDQESVVNASRAAPALFIASRRPGARSHVDLGGWRKTFLDDNLEAHGPSRGDHLAGATCLDESKCNSRLYWLGDGVAHLVGRMRRLQHVRIRTRALVTALPPLMHLRTLHVYPADGRAGNRRNGWRLRGDTADNGGPFSMTGRLLRDIVSAPSALRDVCGSMAMTEADARFWRGLAGVRRVRLERVEGVDAHSVATMRDAWPLLESLELGADFDKNVGHLAYKQLVGSLIHALLVGARSPPALILHGDTAPDPVIALSIPAGTRVSVLRGAVNASGRLLAWLRRLRPDEVVVRRATGIPVDALAGMGAASRVRRMVVTVADQKAVQCGEDRRYVVPHDADSAVDHLTVHVTLYVHGLVNAAAVVRCVPHVRLMEVFFDITQQGVEGVAERLRSAGTHTVDVADRESSGKRVVVVRKKDEQQLD